MIRRLVIVVNNSKDESRTGVKNEWINILQEQTKTLVQEYRFQDTVFSI